MNLLSIYSSEVNGIMVCFKTGPVTHRAPPSIPIAKPLSAVDELRSSLHYINIASTPAQTVITFEFK